MIFVWAALVGVAAGGMVLVGFGKWARNPASPTLVREGARWIALAVAILAASLVWLIGS